MKVKELLSDDSVWIKGHFAVDINHQSVPACSRYAVKFCLEGAIRKCYGLDNEYKPFCKVQDYINKISNCKSNCPIPYWNDNTTFEEVKKLVEELDI